MPQPRIGVIGTGVVGAMTAWRLAQRGVDALALDTYSPGHDRGASAGESRIFRTAYKEGARYVPLLQRAGKGWRELEEHTGAELLTMCGGLTIGPVEHPDVAAVRRCAEDYDLELEVLDTHSARRRFPQHQIDEDEIMLLDPAAGVLRPEPAVQAALRAAHEAGAKVLPYHPVDTVTETSHGWRISSAASHFDVDHIVFAPGPWATQLGPLQDLPVQAKTLAACWFTAHDASLHEPQNLPVAIRRHQEAGFSCFPSLDGVSIKMIPHHLERPVLDDPDSLPRNASSQFAQAASAAAARLLPGVIPHPMRLTTYVDGFTPDDHALVGDVPGCRNATLLTGFSGHGFKIAPVLGEIGADLALHGETEYEIGQLDPSRFAQHPAPFSA